MSWLMRQAQAWDLIDEANQRIMLAARAGNAEAYATQLLERAWGELLMRDCWEEADGPWSTSRRDAWNRLVWGDVHRAEGVIEKFGLGRRAPARPRRAA